MRFFLMIVALFITLGLNKWLKFDVDDRKPGDPQRAHKAKAAYPKSYVHALQAFTLTFVGAIFAGVHVAVVAIVVALILLGWELTQGFIDWKDVAANTVGGILAVVVFYLSISSLAALITPEAT